MCVCVCVNDNVCEVMCVCEYCVVCVIILILMCSNVMCNVSNGNNNEILLFNVINININSNVNNNM
jgi:hypothetical protein